MKICEKHPTYKGDKKPRFKCEICADIYKVNQMLEIPAFLDRREKEGKKNGRRRKL